MRSESNDASSNTLAVALSLSSGAAPNVTPALVVERRLHVVNGKGLHLRAAARIVKLVQQFNAEVPIEYRGALANARSVLSIVRMSVPSGASLVIRGTGTQAADALDAMGQLLTDILGWPEQAQTAPAAGATEHAVARTSPWNSNPPLGIH